MEKERSGQRCEGKNYRYPGTTAIVWSHGRARLYLSTSLVINY